MTKSDCATYVLAYTTASNGSEQIKVWYCEDYDTKQRHYFLDNGAECGHLLESKNGELWYQGGGWLEKLLGKSFKGTSEDIDKLKKYILYGAIIIAILALMAPTGIALIKKLKNQNA